MDHTAMPSTRGRVDSDTLPPIDLPQSDWGSHPVLRLAQFVELGDALEWPTATPEQLEYVRPISLVVDDNGDILARLCAEFNFDRFVDAATDEAAPAHPVGHVPDRQRYYMRITANGFHIVGIFSAVTVEGRRRYFQWLTGAWVEIGLRGFLYVRDDRETNFSEVSPSGLEESQPGATTADVLAHLDLTLDPLPSTPASLVLAPAAQAAAAHFAAEDVAVEVAAAEFPVAEFTAAEFLATEFPAAEHGAADRGESENSAAKYGAAASNEPAGHLTSPAPADPTAAVQRAIAIALATVVHRGRLDLAGAPFIDHPARVAEQFDPETDIVRHSTAWLHDVLESGALSASDLLDAGVHSEIVDAVIALTRLEGQSFAEYIASIRANPDALAVKIAAIEDNASPWRLRRLDADTHDSVQGELDELRSAFGLA